MREAEYCYDAIPISHTKFNYMDVETRMLKSTAEISPCMESFPLRIQTEQGWVRIKSSRNKHRRSYMMKWEHICITRPVQQDFTPEQN